MPDAYRQPPNARAYRVPMRGDGPISDRDLKDFLVGRRIVDLEAGGMTHEGYACLKLMLDGEEALMLAAIPVGMRDFLATGLRTDFSLVFLRRGPGRIYFPGQNAF